MELTILAAICIGFCVFLRILAKTAKDSTRQEDVSVDEIDDHATGDGEQTMKREESDNINQRKRNAATRDGKRTKAKRKNRNQRKRNANKDDGVSQMHCKPKTVKDLMPYDKKYAELQKSAYWRSCSFCKAKRYNTKLCQGCGLVRYCGKNCRRRDRKFHNKHLCDLVYKFNTAISKLDPEIVKVLHVAGFSKQISCYLGSIPDWTRYEMLEGSRVCVVVEIVEIIPEPNFCKVLVKDMTNQTTEITFNTFRNCATPEEILYFLFLVSALIPGNFLLLRNIWWRFYEHKAAKLIIDDLRMVYPIILSEQEGNQIMFNFSVCESESFDQF